MGHRTSITSDACSRLPAGALDLGQGDRLDEANLSQTGLLLSKIDEDEIARSRLEATTFTRGELGGGLDDVFGEHGTLLGGFHRRRSVTGSRAKLVFEEA